MTYMALNHVKLKDNKTCFNTNYSNNLNKRKYTLHGQKIP